MEYIVDTEQLLGIEACRTSFYVREQKWVELAIEAAKQELVVNFASTFVIKAAVSASMNNRE